MQRQSTAYEIWKDIEANVDIVVSGLGTGGTISGVDEFLKVKNPSIKMIVVEPTESPVLSGGKSGTHKIQGIGIGFVPIIYDKKLTKSILAKSKFNSGQSR